MRNARPSVANRVASADTAPAVFQPAGLQIFHREQLIRRVAHVVHPMTVGLAGILGDRGVGQRTRRPREAGRLRRRHDARPRPRVHRHGHDVALVAMVERGLARRDAHVENAQVGVLVGDTVMGLVLDEHLGTRRHRGSDDEDG